MDEAPAIPLKIKEAILVVNEMRDAGVIGQYAIGGAVGATFYLEPVRTLDVDIFVALQAKPGEIILSLRPIYEYLNGRGYPSEGEYLLVAGWPVQFLPSTGSLVDEAIAQAVEIDVEDVRARVFTAEHLAAIALQTGRAKDKARILQFLEADAIDRECFSQILRRHALVDQWARFEQQFSTDP
jgi:hypothetical protein